MIPQARDEEICAFIKSVGIASTSQIEKMFFSHCKYSGNVARRRMQKLTEGNFVRRWQPDQSSQYVYWIDGKKPSQAQLEHKLIIADIYVAIRKMTIGYIEEWQREPQFDGIRPDAFLKYIIPMPDGRKKQCNRCFEVERMTGNEFNQKKYEKFYESNEWGKLLGISQFPRVVIVSDKRIAITETSNRISYVIIPTSLKNISSIF
jgi:hypothetical protein